MTKSADMGNTPEPSAIEAKNGQGMRRPSTSGKPAAGSDAAAGPAQMDFFQEGMRLFHVRQLQQARESFLQAMRGADRTVAHRAGLHARMCEQRLAAPGIVLNTSEEHYNYAITLINSRNLGEAQKHLRVALDGDPGGDHVLYALAACQSLGGDLLGACENLKRAIDLQPRNRLAARQDPDFSAMSDYPGFTRLLYPDKKV